MRGAFGKPQGVCARVDIGQILLSIRCKDVHNAQVRGCFARHLHGLWLALYSVASTQGDVARQPGLKLTPCARGGLSYSHRRPCGGPSSSSPGARRSWSAATGASPSLRAPTTWRGKRRAASSTKASTPGCKSPARMFLDVLSRNMDGARGSDRLSGGCALTSVTCAVQLLGTHGPLDARPAEHLLETPSRRNKVPIHYEDEQ